MAIMQVPVTKGKGVVEIDTDAIPEAVYAECLLQGLKVLLNRGQSKITIAELGDAETVKTEAMLAAEKQKAKILAGDIKFSGKAKATKVSGAVNTEAMRIARNRVKDALKANSIKISHVAAKDITAAAKELISADPSIIEQAEAALKAREATPMPIDIKALISADPKLVAKAEARKKKDAEGKPLSAKQAGMVAGRTKPKKGDQASTQH